MSGGWERVPAGYAKGEYLVFREGRNPAYPWAVLRNGYVIDLARTMREAKERAELHLKD